MPGPISDTERLMKHISHWSWVHFLYTYNETHLLIADRFFISRVQKARAQPLTCKVATPEKYQQAITPAIRKILVFSRENELALIRSIQKAHPDVKVTSGTYGFACNDRTRLPKLVEYKKPSLPKEAQPPVVMISAPGAEAEFVTKVMAENDLPYCHEYLGRANGTWTRQHRNFQVARFFAGAMERYAKEGQPALLLQTDVLKQLFENTSFKLRHLIKYLRSSGAKVVLVRRKDLVMPAVFGQILDRTAERSIWTKKERKKLQLKLLPEDYEGCVMRLIEHQRADAMLDAIALALSDDVIDLTLEDFVADQQEALSRIADHLNVKIEKPWATISYDEGFENVRSLLDETLNFKRQLIDKVGIHLIR